MSNTNFIDELIPGEVELVSTLEHEVVKFRDNIPCLEFKGFTDNLPDYTLNFGQEIDAKEAADFMMEQLAKYVDDIVFSKCKYETVAVSVSTDKGYTVDNIRHYTVRANIGSGDFNITKDVLMTLCDYICDLERVKVRNIMLTATPRDLDLNVLKLTIYVSDKSCSELKGLSDFKKVDDKVVVSKIYNVDMSDVKKGNSLQDIATDITLLEIPSGQADHNTVDDLNKALYSIKQCILTQYMSVNSNENGNLVNIEDTPIVNDIKNLKDNYATMSVNFMDKYVEVIKANIKDFYSKYIE